MTVTPFGTLTAGERKTVLSLLSFLVLLGHATLIGYSSTWNFSDHGLAASGRSIARDDRVGRRAEDDAARLRPGCIPADPSGSALIDQHRRMQLAIRIGHDHDRAQAGAFVELLAQRHARHEVLPAQLAVDLDDARVVVRVPGVEDRRALVVVALGDVVASP